MPTREEWKQFSEDLQDPFDPEDVDFRIIRGSQVAGYIDARAVMRRLDDVVGAENWSFDWTPIITNDKDIVIAKGSLTIYGVTKSDVADQSNVEQSKGAVSDCLKRAAVHWGIGRYLYELERKTVSGNQVTEADKKRLRQSLPKPKGYVAPPVNSTQPATQPATQQTAKSTPVAAARPVPTADTPQAVAARINALSPTDIGLQPAPETLKQRIRDLIKSNMVDGKLNPLHKRAVEIARTSDLSSVRTAESKLESFLTALNTEQANLFIQQWPTYIKQAKAEQAKPAEQPAPVPPLAPTPPTPATFATPVPELDTPGQAVPVELRYAKSVRGDEAPSVAGLRLMQDTLKTLASELLTYGDVEGSEIVRNSNGHIRSFAGPGGESDETVAIAYANALVDQHVRALGAGEKRSTHYTASEVSKAIHFLRARIDAIFKNHELFEDELAVDDEAA